MFLSVLLSCCSLLSFADGEVRQVVQIDGQIQQEEVKNLTFSGDEVTITFRNGQAAAAKLDSFTISFSGMTTSIRQVVNDKSLKDDAYYDLLGIKMRPDKKGIYIHNGKKTIRSK